MEIHDDNVLLRTLVENLHIAKRIGMRGEVIDMAIFFKALVTKLLQEMLQRTADGEDDDEDPEEELYMLREEDRTKSVYDPFYNEFIDMSAEKMGMTSELEPHLGFHPYSTDYNKIYSLNYNYACKNLSEARKFLHDEETYALINIYTRCSFLLTDGGTDSSKSIDYNNGRDDDNLKLARLIFRYRLDLDELF